MGRTSSAKIETLSVKELHNHYKKKKAKIIPVKSKNYEYYSPEQYGDMLGLTARTVTAMCRSGNIEGVFKINNQWRIPVRRE